MCYQHFKQSDRDEISILLKKDYSHRDIAHAIGKNHSSVSREIRLNSVNGQYDPRKAQLKSRLKRRESKYQGMKISGNTDLEIKIAVGIMAGWSPEEVSGRISCLNNGQNVISAKSIYKYCYSVYGQYLCQYLPHKRYRPKRRKGSKTAKSIISNRIFIDFRPKIIGLQKRFGDFEGDTLGRPKHENETLVGAVERQSLYFIGCKVPRLKYSIDGFKKILSPHHKIVKSLTLDNGVENVRHEELKVKTYFCHPYSSWEKGIIENTFGRLRCYIPKKSSLTDYSAKEISDIIEAMNNTPRKKLGYRTPKEVFNELSAKHINPSKCCTSG